jgi:hypothetical protein
MTDDEKSEIETLLESIREKLKLPTYTNLDNTTTWTTGDSMNYKDTMLDSTYTIDTSQWNLAPTTIAPLTSTQLNGLTTSYITNMGIGTTGSMAPFTFDIGHKYQNKEFETHMPQLHKIKEMCEMFPGFKKAYDHMRTVYDLVHEEYQERIKEK